MCLQTASLIWQWCTECLLVVGLAAQAVELYLIRTEWSTRVSLWCQEEGGSQTHTTHLSVYVIHSYSHPVIIVLHIRQNGCASKNDHQHIN